MTVILYSAFFLSGASALIFEAVWFHLTGLSFGNSIWATSIVLAAFMGGLALGNGLVAFRGHKIKFPIRVYAFLEILIAISGFALVFILPSLTKLLVLVFQSFEESSFVLNVLRTVFAFCLMVIPASAMGATLPVLIKALYSKDPSFGRVLGSLYGWNTFGATVGVILTELYFIKWFGIKGTAGVAVCLNLMAAFTALGLYKKQQAHSSITRRAPEDKAFVFPTLSWKIIRILLASFLSGFTLLALEVVWFRFMILFFIPTGWHFAIMLATVLSGISLGGFFASRYFRSHPNMHRFLTFISLLNGILIVLIYTNFIAVYNFFEHSHVIINALFLMFPVSFVSGNMFTMCGKMLHEAIRSETQASGLLTLSNTIGGMVGPLVAGFILIPYVGVEKSFFLFACMYGAIAFLIYEKNLMSLPRKSFKINYVVIGTYLLCLMIFPFGFMDFHYLAIPLNQWGMLGDKRVAVKEGLTETIQYLQKNLLDKPYSHRLVTNNFSMSGTHLESKRYMKLFVYLPVAVVPEMKNALLICFGVGSTAKALTDTKSFQNIEIVDVSRDIIEGSGIIFPDPSENPIYDSRTKVHIEDGRFFLLTTERTFDLITAEPPPPALSGIVNLYTQEYFQLIYDRLSDGGMLTYWLPVYQLSVEKSKSIIKGFCNVFPECSLWTGSGLEWMMVGTKNSKKPVSEEKFIRQWNDPEIGSEMKALGFENPEQFGSFFIADGQRLQDWISESLPLTDNYPQRLSHYIWSQQIENKTYIDFMNYADSQTNFMNSEGIKKIWPESFLEKTEKYFAARQIINEMLDALLERQNKVVYLHQALHNPLLTHYILWVLDSNQYAQNIISKTPQEAPEIYIHLAAKAVREGNFLQAEHYLHLMGGPPNKQNLLSESEHFTLCSLRMYLLAIAGKKEQAMIVGQEYINRTTTNTAKREEDIEAYWRWLAPAVM